MFDVTMTDMRAALDSFKIEDDSILLTHSSLKSPGLTEGGADGIIKAIFDTVPNGTVVFPTLSQKNWKTVYEDWTLDRPSDVGTISETFRAKYATHRSNNATHSVAAAGKFAKEITDGHDLPPIRYGLFGDYTFSINSPWQRMFDSRQNYGVRSYVLFWGVTMRCNTFKHFSEYRFVNDLLCAIKDNKRREEVKSLLSHYPYNASAPDFLWPFYSSEEFMKVLENDGLLRKVKLGKSSLILCDVYDATSRVDVALRQSPEEFVTPPQMLRWVKIAQEAAKCE